MLLKLLLKVLTTEAAKQLAVYAAAELAKRTDNAIDDTAVRLIAKTLGVAAPALEVTDGQA
jgi:hypothetical protein